MKKSRPVTPQVNEQLHKWLAIVNGVYRTAHGTAAIAAGCRYARNKAISRVAAQHRFIKSLFGGASFAVIAFLARMTGVEPTTDGLEIRCSVH